MNTVELLMAADAAKFSEAPTAQLEIKALSEKLGQKFVVKIRALSSRRFTELSSMVLTKNNTADMLKMTDTQALMIVDSMVEPNLRDKALQEHFGVKTPKDLALKLFQGGDLVAIANKITELSGYGESSVEEIKN